MASFAIHPCLVLCLLLVAPHLGSCYHSSKTYGGRHVVLRSSDDDSSAPPTCSPIPRDVTLSITHRLSPCSPYGADSDRSMPTVSNTFNNDALRLCALSRSSYSTSGLTIPLTGTPLVALPGASEYHVNVGYGTPVQNLTVGFDTATVGATVLQCKPCAAAAPCDKAFDPSRSSSLERIQCASQDCPFKSCSGPTCTIAVTRKGTVLVNATFVTDTLTVAPSVAVNDFRVACLEMGARTIAGDTLVEVHTTFTYLKPDAYAVLRDKFRWWMKQYMVAPSSGELDTCYDFTGLTSIEVPMISLRFHGGASLELGIEQMMYFKDRRNIFSVACLAFAPVSAYAPGGAVIGSLAQSETEVVYDLLGGKLGFVPSRCAS